MAFSSLIGCYRLIWPILDPGLRCFALAIFLELINEIAQPAAQHAAGRGASQATAETAQHSTRFARPGTSARPLALVQPASISAIFSRF